MRIDDNEVIENIGIPTALICCELDRISDKRQRINALKATLRALFLGNGKFFLTAISEVMDEITEEFQKGV